MTPGIAPGSEVHMSEGKREQFRARIPDDLLDDVRELNRKESERAAADVSIRETLGRIVAAGIATRKRELRKAKP